MERMKMDRRRLEHAHFRYAMLNVAEWYQGFAKILFTPDQAERTLLEFTPLYLKAFYENYSGKYIHMYINNLMHGYICTYTGHRCSKAGCGSVLVIDGNLKNHRSVCAASEAGYVQYAGLPGKIKTGCTNTPCQKSRFCPAHKPRTLTTDNEGSSSKVIEMILEKKTLRSHTMYKVEKI